MLLLVLLDRLYLKFGESAATAIAGRTTRTSGQFAVEHPAVLLSFKLGASLAGPLLRQRWQISG